MFSANLRLLALAVTAAAVLTAALPPAGAAPAVRAGCNLNAAVVTVSKTPQVTTSTSNVDVTETGTRFTQGGTRAGCILVSFSAEAAATNNETMEVSALLDGTVCEPGPDTAFVVSNAAFTGFAARAMSYVCTGVAPGAHVVKMQFRSKNGGTVQLNSRTVAVQYFK